ncbi:MAG: adenylate/guanylate cyclase domain-containing protein [Actinomycetota bacterium]|nr:adenylate/guanylate cyclase domain-containing protein [Actinomycetota bacterium]
MEPETRYARSGDVNIAYQVTGDGPFDVVYVPPFVSHVELAWQVPEIAGYHRRLASFARLIRLDKRGTGMSDRVSGAPTLEARMDDVRAVMDAVGSERAALIGVSEGGPMSILFAATYPERAWALVLVGSYARELWAPDYPCGLPEDEHRLYVESVQDGWGTPKHGARVAAAMAPSASDETKHVIATMIRQSASPGAVTALLRMNSEIDVRQALKTIRIPALVLNRAGEEPDIVGGSRYLAESIPGARHIELPGSEHAQWAGDAEPGLRETERFLTEAWKERAWEDAESDRVLVTVLFTDIVGSTARAAELGDARWRELIHAHHGLIRRQLVRFRGVELDTAGDGFFATFDGPARAIRCASAISEGVRDLGIEVRAGLHTGECERIDHKVGGIAVNIGARVAAEAGAGEVLVSSTVKDLVAGSGIEFRERGVAELKGVPGEWRLFAVERLAAAET